MYSDMVPKISCQLRIGNVYLKKGDYMQETDICVNSL